MGELQQPGVSNERVEAAMRSGGMAPNESAGRVERRRIGLRDEWRIMPVWTHQWTQTPGSAQLLIRT